MTAITSALFHDKAGVRVAGYTGEPAQRAYDAARSGAGKFDPTDLVMLTVGFTSITHDISTETAEILADAAAMLHTLWQEIPAGEWDGVWAYDIAEPLGVQLAQLHKAAGLATRPSLADRTETLARALITQAQL